MFEKDRCPFCDDYAVREQSNFFDDVQGCECKNMTCDTCHSQWIAYIDDDGEIFDVVKTSS